MFAQYLREGEGWDICLNFAAMGGAMFFDFNRFLHSTGPTRGLYGWASPVYDAMQAEAMNAGSYAGMMEKFAEIQVWVMEQLAYFPTFVAFVIQAHTVNLEGLVMHPNMQLWNPATLRIPE
jgi:ABC-type oligopeptide transport system substrate-binding subunit